MTVKELIKTLQQLPDEIQNSEVLCGYKTFRGELETVEEIVEFDSIRIESIGVGNRKRQEVILY